MQHTNDLQVIEDRGASPQRTAGGEARLAANVARRAARLRRTARSLASDVGQGTVEYVGLLLLMATLLAGVVTVAKNAKTDAIPKKVTEQIEHAIDQAGGSKR